MIALHQMLWRPPFMTEATFPKTWADAGKGIVANLTWILPLVTIERAVEQHFVQAAILLLCWFVVVGIAIKWNAFEGLRRRQQMAWVAIILGTILLGIGIFLLATRPSAVSTSAIASTDAITTETAASAVGAPAQGAIAASASLNLLMRPNQDPLEISRDNVWRWYAFKMLGQDASGTQHTIATFIYLTFDRPTQVNYRRVFSPSHPNLRFDVLDLTQRSMVIGINNVDISGATVEVKVSGTPL